MNIETIAGIVLECIQIIGMVVGCYIVKGKSVKTDIKKIIEMIPLYIADANTQIPNATTAVKVSYILAEMKEDLTEAGMKFKEKELKNEIEKEVTKNAEQKNNQ